MAVQNHSSPYDPAAPGHESARALDPTRQSGCMVGDPDTGAEADPDDDGVVSPDDDGDTDPAEVGDPGEGADVASLARSLRAEARRSDQRRLLVLSGDPDRTAAAVRTAFSAVDVDPAATTLVGDRDLLACERLGPGRADDLLGSTREAVVLDAHDELRPSALGSVAGAVDGGGLLVLLAPPLSTWPDRRDAFDARLAVEPHDVGDVTGHFRRRLVDTLRTHPGVAVVDVDAGVIEREGLTEPPPREAPDPVAVPERSAFPAAAHRACRTRDQADVVGHFERLRPPQAEHKNGGNGDADPQAVVVEADRGRGKSSAAGLAAGSLAAEGADVLVTAPAFRSARELFARARDLLDDLGALDDDPAGRENRSRDDGTDSDIPRRLTTGSGGRIRYCQPAEVGAEASEADVLFVDEAAALPAGILAETLAADRVAYTTTVRGYEGTGRGFAVRFRERLDGSRHGVTDVRMDEPIRYAAGDPVETWAFRALLLDARPPVDQVVADATSENVDYRALPGSDLVADEHLLRATFGLLVLAHYRTDPDDLARLLDAPNVAVRALVHEGRVVSVALLAREGGLDAETRGDLYEGARIPGHMIPDVLTSQLRDENAGRPRGVRVLRIATHHAVRSRGLGSRLLAAIREEYGDGVDWLGVGYGATPRLVAFWRENGFRAVHLSTTRNDRSGEHSAIMLAPTGPAGADLHDRHAARFARRLPGMLSAPLSGVDPDVVRATLRAVEARVDPNLSATGWRLVAGAAYGPAIFSVDPDPFRRLVVAHLVDPADPDALDARQERLLVGVILQAREPGSVADELGFHSPGQCLRAVGDALAPLVDLYGDDAAREERDRYRE